ncbi:tRNA pseudouridine synthase B [Candidatus Kryptonium thompsonii]|uniref:tRNA pseudouridine synthase B n=1 Tax=Candidatus Kryptonium thompsonii TaxID=1633631 RepID=A0A0P1LG81_9BACT|nr:tRNA pseudouridine(55) synthase TruB [Candidatus Kryptonium thompsoni]CUS80693.1 tRNA pseudouridine synthase B [Candidatus Kryptonium thompsoni]CUS81670.1 tRNA pseudouridine synthase B [Candidatus Kryptonium thompsoni]CUS83636.1 tRNA pseudouridine synthase B [Candidatus Kryptonium thompsoni]CUS97432.1 tRNA pseudouridine synthase B [Candidatus Kryptonium thompsoni]CUT05153.1 tRNA pseudouridine synthase B [Candidatus Kryptonium thompsoni]
MKIGKRIIEVTRLAQKIREGEIILVNKPSGWTSYRVVDKIKRWFKVKKAGHGGTLDPFATGLLIVATGKKTKELSKIAELDKEYEGVMELGAVTISYDPETEIVERRNLNGITEEVIRENVKRFIGEIEQVPPMYSAVKYKGKPLYSLARKGITVERKPRKVKIYDFQILEVNLPEVRFRVRCSKGTYVRSLVYDFGESLGCGAYLKSLVRTRIGEYKLEDALTIEELKKISSQGTDGGGEKHK